MPGKRWMKGKIRERIESALAVKPPRDKPIPEDGVNWDPRVDWGDYHSAIREMTPVDELVLTVPEWMIRANFRARIATIGRRAWKGKDGWRFVTRTNMKTGKVHCKLFRLAAGR